MQLLRLNKWEFSLASFSHVLHPIHHQIVCDLRLYIRQLYHFHCFDLAPRCHHFSVGLVLVSASYLATWLPPCSPAACFLPVSHSDPLKRDLTLPLKSCHGFPSCLKSKPKSFLWSVRPYVKCLSHLPLFPPAHFTLATLLASFFCGTPGSLQFFGTFFSPLCFACLVECSSPK